MNNTTNTGKTSDRFVRHAACGMWISGALLALLAIVPLGFAAETQSVTPAPAIRTAPAAAGLPPLPAVVREESLEQQEARLKWFREARFGLFIHWGVYAVPAGSWQGKPAGAEWIMNRAKISLPQTRELVEKFNPDILW